MYLLIYTGYLKRKSTSRMAISITFSSELSFNHPSIIYIYLNIYLILLYLFYFLKNGFTKACRYFEHGLPLIFVACIIIINHLSPRVLPIKLFLVPASVTKAVLSYLWDDAYKRVAHVAAAGFLSSYLSGPKTPYNRN